MEAADEARVLVIYTGTCLFFQSRFKTKRALLGGTIGMLVGQHGYVPEPNFLTDTLRCQTRFHDPFQESLFSNSGTVQGYRAWSSGRSSPQSMTSRSLPDSPDEPTPGTLLVRSSRPIGHHTTLDALDVAYTRNQPKCTLVSENIYEAHLPSLITPRTKAPNGTTSKAIRYAILEVSCHESLVSSPQSLIFKDSSGIPCSIAQTWTLLVLKCGVSLQN
jgi:lysophospholipase